MKKNQSYHIATCMHQLVILIYKSQLQYRSKILGPKYAHKTRLRVKHARVCVFDTRMRYAQKANSLVFMS